VDKKKFIFFCLGKFPKMLLQASKHYALNGYILAKKAD